MIYALTTFLSAFLLFMLQPLMGKMILPWFGGTPAVWTTCMLFFQVTLLGGYAYAHLLSSRLRPRAQAWLHVALLAIALVLMAAALARWGSPILPGESWKPVATEAPVPHILALLLVSIGLPYGLLSATSPLLQRWFSLLGHGERTYRLYAVSNVGSLLGLLAYPFLTERWLDLPTQAGVWAAGFTVFAAGCAAIAWQLQRAVENEPEPGRERGPASARPPALTLLMWLLLTMCTSALLLAVTNELCQEVAAVPFLWIIPLALYLISFIICFDRPRWYRRRVFVAITAVLTLAVLTTSSLGLQLGIPVQIAVFGLFLFFFCMTCHGELVGLKPEPRHLTLFYLIIALGGALGGVFVGLLAPRWFTHYWEFNVMATVAWVVLALIFLRDRDSFFYRGDWWAIVLFGWFLLYTGARLGLVHFENLANAIGPWSGAILLPALLTFPLAVLLVWPWRQSRLARHWFWPRLLVGLVIFLAELFMVAKVRQVDGSVIAADRNFYGTLRVVHVPAAGPAEPAYLQLTHGRINHGRQYLDADLRTLPVTYYGVGSGIELAVTRHLRRRVAPGRPREPLRIGVLGLGTGTMAAFAESGDTVVFYEINPTVIRYADGPEAVFQYLHESRGSVEIVPGDARLSLERELAEGRARQFDILVMDAFSSDSVPVHLLTKEVFALYQAHLRDADSIIAVNVSNRFLDLRDLVATQADEARLLPLYVGVPEQPPRRSASAWMVLTASEDFLRDPEVRARALPWMPRQRLVWTDAYSNLLPTVRRWSKLPSSQH